jgi:nitrite reductase/ring-hydroxylating ferredoxin subunit
MGFVRIAAVEEVPPGTAKQVAVNGRKLGLYNVNGSFYVLEDVCPHRGAPLTEGECEGAEVICPWHGARFDLATGSHLSPPAQTGVTAYRVQVVGSEVQADLP